MAVEGTIMAVNLTEDLVLELMRLWSGKLPHKRAKKKLQYVADKGCPLLPHCLECPKVTDGCPVLEGDDDDDSGRQ